LGRSVGDGLAVPAVELVVPQAPTSTVVSASTDLDSICLFLISGPSFMGECGVLNTL